ncbi:MAG TPA: sodium-independent anion transporter, partial [Dysgonomonas sp.]|nr:sodium-independent anion transporter [Dysgonomonas sp.]
TGIHNLESLCKKSHDENIHIILSGVLPNVREALENAGMDKIVGRENICDNINLALKRADEFLAEESTSETA